MAKYRIHIDIPIEDNFNYLQSGLNRAHIIMEAIKRAVESLGDVEQMNYRLGEDSDRKNSNYFDINDNGHCSHKKTRWNREDMGQ